jgi:glycosyltransferase involved in cell wall biosynthesis
MTGTRPKVSIGIPVYNGEKYLEDALNSILKQTYKDFELIFADNASNDRTRKICLGYAQMDPRVRYHRNERNIGAAPNHNLLFHLARGEYFKWAAYDDVIAPDFLARCVEVLDNHPDVVLCMPMTGRIDENGKYLGNYEYIAGADLPDRLKGFRNFALYNRSGNFIYGLMRASSLSQTSLHGSYPSSDLTFLAELALYGKFHVLPEYLFFRRSHPGQSTKGILSKERLRTLWFDTSLGGRIILPKWLNLFGYLNVIKKAPLRGSERFYCYLQMIRWILIPRHFRGLIKDVIRAALKILAQFPVRLKAILTKPIDMAKG